MSIATEVTRIQAARNKIRDKLIALGLVQSTAQIDALATAIDGIEDRGAITASVQEGDTYTIPKGYHNGAGTVSGVAGGGNYNLQSKTVTPTKNQQSITPDQGFFGLSDVTVKAIPDAYQNVSSVTAAAEDVLATKTIVDATGTTVVGTMPNNGAVTKKLTGGDKDSSYTIPKGYHNGSGTVSVDTESMTVTPSEDLQRVTPTAGKLIKEIIVNAIPDKYINALLTFLNITNDTENLAAASHILTGKHAYIGQENSNTQAMEIVKVEGTMADYTDSYREIDALEEDPTITLPTGYYNGAEVTISDSLEQALAAI